MTERKHAFKYAILRCSKCGAPEVYGRWVRSKCSSCKKPIVLKECTILGGTDSPKEAGFILRGLKQQDAERGKTATSYPIANRAYQNNKSEGQP